MLAALVQCLVHLFDTQLDRGYRLPSRAPWVIADNKWRATRYGLDAYHRHQRLRGDRAAARRDI